MESNGTTIIEFRYAHDREGNRWYKRIISPEIGGEYGTDSVELYRYDGVYRVTGVKYGVEPSQIGDIQNNTHQLPHSWDYYSGTSQTDYELDGVGNRKTVIRDGQTETYVTNSVNEYVYVNNKRLMYDQNGNLTQWNDKKLHYNHNNQLVEVTYAEGGFDWDWWFRYGVLGRRMTESFSDGLVHHRKFWYDGQMVIYEESDGVKYRYYNGNLIDEVLCREDQFGGQIWYLTDALGSVYVLTDNSGDVVEAYHYSIYGGPKVYSATGQQRNLTDYDNRVLFTGREYIWQLHLYYYRARYYAPYLGRFLQRDPLTCERFARRIAILHVLNYRYARLRPTVLIDPHGKKPFPCRIHDCCPPEERCLKSLIPCISDAMRKAWQYIQGAYTEATKNGKVPMSFIFLTSVFKLREQDVDLLERVYENMREMIEDYLEDNDWEMECESSCNGDVIAYVRVVRPVRVFGTWDVIHICPRFFCEAAGLSHWRRACAWLDGVSNALGLVIIHEISHAGADTNDYAYCN